MNRVRTWCWALTEVSDSVPLMSLLSAMDGLAEVLTQIATPEERATIHCLPETSGEAAFFRLWMRNEALLKAIGIGFAEAPQTHQVGSEVWSAVLWRGLGVGQGASLPAWCRQLLAPLGHEAAVVVSATGRNRSRLHQISLPTDWLEQPI